MNITLSIEEIKSLLRYALAHCNYNCPAERSPETCLLLVRLSEKADFTRPPCVEEMGGFSAEKFREKIRDIEARRRKPIADVLSQFEREGTMTLQDEVDKIEGKFAMEVLDAMDRERKRESKVKEDDK